MKTLITIICIIAFLVPIIWYLHYKNVIKLSGMKAPAFGKFNFPFEELGTIALEAIAYLAFLFLLYTAAPAFWNAWWTPPSFFWATNIMLLICVIGASLVVKKWWGFWGALFVIAVIYYHCKSEMNVAVVKENTTANTTNDNQNASQNVAQSIAEIETYYTPFEVYVEGPARLVYTAGEAIYMLPPGWDEKDAIYYDGKNEEDINKQTKIFIPRDKRFHRGIWKFWSAEDKKKVFLVKLKKANN